MAKKLPMLRPLSSEFSCAEGALECGGMTPLSPIHYVHQNPVHHGIVRNASEYRWCSAAWFERSARPAFVKSVYRFRTERIMVEDDF
jgi:hypothetical protein